MIATKIDIVQSGFELCHKGSLPFLHRLPLLPIRFSGLPSILQSLPAAAKTLYGLAYLIENKPWYDFQKGFTAVKEAAESDDPFSWFILGSLYLNGKPEIPKDPVLAKYWIEKAADAGHKDAVLIRELQWGDNPEGFVGWLADRLEKESKWRRWIGIGVIALVVIALIFLLIK